MQNSLLGRVRVPRGVRSRSSKARDSREPKDGQAGLALLYSSDGPSLRFQRWKSRTTWGQVFTHPSIRA